MYKNDFSALAAKLGYEEEVLRYIIRNANGYYRPFHLILQKNGKRKIRHIDSPGKKSALYVLQKAIHERLLLPEINLLPSPLVGGLKKKNLLQHHLMPHVHQPAIVCMDLENCFPNISRKRLFNIWVNILGYSPEIAKLLNRATTFKSYLPQGPPTSPLLCNFALSGMSLEIVTLTTANNLAYTQFVDDICISGDDNVVRAMVGEIYKIADSYGQSINADKTEIMDRKHQQRSARVVLNDAPKLLRAYSDRIIGEIRAFRDAGIVTTGEKMHIMGEIIYLKKFSPTEAARVKSIFVAALQATVELDGKRPKAGTVKPCFYYLKNVHRCPCL